MSQDMIPYLLGALQLVVGGLGLVLWSNFTALKVEGLRQAGLQVAASEKAAKELADHRLHTAENYTTKGDLTKAFDSLNRTLESVLTTMTSRFDKMDTKLDSKADKGN